MQELVKLNSWVKPTTDAQWAEDVKAESFDIKYDYQLVQMKEDLTNKLPLMEKKLDEYTKFSDYFKHLLEEQFSGDKTMVFDKDGLCEGRTLKQWVEDEFQQEHEYYQWKVGKINQSLERIGKEQELRTKKAVERKPIGTVYYVDPVNGVATHTGTKLTGTIDSTADNTHVTDNAWAGADDYINGSYFYNSTVGAGSIISDFVALTDTITLATAINGMNANDVYYILDSWLDLDTFTEAARSAGDRCVVRRTAAANCDNGTDLVFQNNGTLVAPIVIESDYDNEYYDKVDLSATATATLTFGSKTVIYSAAINGVLAAGDWIYASGDNVREFAYEVSTITGAGNDTVTLYLPYKGAQAGAGVTTYNIQDNPIWNTAAGDLQWTFNADNYWKIQGIHIRGTDTSGNVRFLACQGHQLTDCIFTGNGATCRALCFASSQSLVILRKCRAVNQTSDIYFESSDTYVRLYIYDSLFPGNGSSPSIYVYAGASYCYYDFKIVETILGTAATDLTLRLAASPLQIGKILCRNVKLTRNIELPASSAYQEVLLEDFDNTPNDTRFASGTNTTQSNAFIYQSETGTVHAGGATTSVKITPHTNLNTISGWDYSKLCLFELPIYATTDSKTYTVYFNLPDANFTVDPTATELWIELEAWGHATNNYRKITKSTGTITSDGNWNSLTVTVAPAQAGIAYLRCYYCKTKEAASNIFYCDPRPEIA